MGDENGQQVAQPQQMMYAAPQQMVYQDPGQQLIYVDENGQQVPAPVPSMVQHVPVGPTVFNISPEQFAQLAQGHAMSQDQINVFEEEEEQGLLLSCEAGWCTCDCHASCSIRQSRTGWIRCDDIERSTCRDCCSPAGCYAKERREGPCSLPEIISFVA